MMTCFHAAYFFSGPKTVAGSRWRHYLYALASFLAWKESTWYTLMRFRLIKNNIAHVYDVYTV